MKWLTLAFLFAVAAVLGPLLIMLLAAGFCLSAAFAGLLAAADAVSRAARRP